MCSAIRLLPALALLACSSAPTRPLDLGPPEPGGTSGAGTLRQVVFHNTTSDCPTPRTLDVTVAGLVVDTVLPGHRVRIPLDAGVTHVAIRDHDDPDGATLEAQDWHVDKAFVTAFYGCSDPEFSQASGERGRLVLVNYPHGCVDGRHGYVNFRLDERRLAGLLPGERTTRYVSPGEHVLSWSDVDGAPASRRVVLEAGVATELAVGCAGRSKARGRLFPVTVANRVVDCPSPEPVTLQFAGERTELPPEQSLTRYLPRGVHLLRVTDPTGKPVGDPMRIELDSPVLLERGACAGSG